MVIELTEAPITYAGATVRRITELKAHPNADRLDIALLGKFQTVVPKGAYAVGDLVIFIEADTVLPPDRSWADPFRKYAEKRVKIVKLRGVFSEGIVVGHHADALRGTSADPECGGLTFRFDGMDVSDALGTTHYEPPVQEPGAIGTLPAFLPKTDEERYEKIEALPEGDPQYTLKVDGTSVTFLPIWEGFPDDEGEHVAGFRIFGRTLEYPADEPNKMSALLNKYRAELTMLAHLVGPNRALRGEAYGEGIQTNKKNPHSKVPGRNWVLYSIFDTEERCYLDFEYVKDACIASGVPSVPLFDWGPLTDELIEKIQAGEALKESYEGIVVKYPNGASFKILNKAYDASK